MWGYTNQTTKRAYWLKTSTQKWTKFFIKIKIDCSRYCNQLSTGPLTTYLAHWHHIVTTHVMDCFFFFFFLMMRVLCGTHMWPGKSKKKNSQDPESDAIPKFCTNNPGTMLIELLILRLSHPYWHGHGIPKPRGAHTNGWLLKKPGNG